MTLADLHALALRAYGSGLEQCADRSPAGIIQEYCPRAIWLTATDGSPVGLMAVPHKHAGGFDDRPLDLSDAGTALAVRVLLALALGMDPGPRGEWVTWERRPWGWMVRCGTADGRGSGRCWINFLPTAEGAPELIHAPTIAALTDPIEALTAAVRHVLEHP